MTIPRPYVVLAISGAIGFVLGATVLATWQVAVESAQVVAGLVKYPPDNPFYIYHLELWTVLHQICALLLRAGVSEITLSRALSGVIAMVSFQAVSLFMYALSRDMLVAIGAPVFIFYTRAVEHGTSYPIELMGSDHTYGVIGLSTAVLVISLFGAGCDRLGAFLLAVTPAIHPSIGLWLLAIVSGCMLWDFKRLRRELRPALPFFIAGATVTAVSLGIYWIMARHVPHVDREVTARYLSAFVTKWDEHRMAVPLITVGSILNVTALALGIIWLTVFARDLPPRALFLLRAVVVSAAISIPLMLVSWVPSDKLPPGMLMLMPARMVNFNVLTFVPLVIGLLAVYRKTFWSAIAMALFCGAIFVNYRSMWWDGFPGGALAILKLNPWHVFVAGAVVAALVATAAAFGRGRGGPSIAVAGRALTLVLFLTAALFTSRLSPPYPLHDRTNDPFFAAVAADRQGLVATAGTFHLVQLYTRRPVLIDGGALDSLPYAPDSGPHMERILRDVYSIDFFNPPHEIVGAGIPYRYNRPVWEGYRRLKWQEIRFTFGVTGVLTPAAWQLDLPIAAEDRSFKLYEIPK